MTPEKDVESGSATDEASHAAGNDPVVDAAAAENEAATDDAATSTADAAESDALNLESEDAPDGDVGEQGDSAEDAVEDAEEDTIESLRERLAAAEALADDHWQRVLRMQADTENQRKRAQKELANARKFAVEGIANDLLPVKDSLEMGLQAAQAEEADIAKILEGTDLTLKMLGQLFEKQNIAEVDPLDQKFDPDFHQAMSMQEVAGRDSNTVINVFQKGYTLNDRLIRPALVVVAK